MNRIGPSKMALYIANADGSNERRLLSSSMYLDYDASFSSDGKWIVFTSERDPAGQGQSDIYRVHPDGTGLERLTSDPTMEDAGVLSPDGRYLAYVSTKGGNRTANIWVMDMRTRRAKRVTGTDTVAPPTTMSGHFRPSWSPDGQWIAFSSDEGEHWAGAETGAGVGHSQPLSIYIVRADGSGLRRITRTTPQESMGTPSWSSDGKALLVYAMETKATFIARMGGFTALAVNAPSQIVRIDVQTGAATPVSSGGGFKVSPQSLPGGRVGYLIKGAPKGGPALGIAYSDGSRGPNGAARSPSWSPDGKSVVYYRYDSTNRLQNTQLYSWMPNYENQYTDVFPTICPRSGKIAVTDLNFPFGNPDASVSVMNADGTERQRVFHRNDGAALMPTWSPDCKSIAVGVGTFFGGRDARPANILLINADGSGSKPLTEGTVNTGFPAWSPDGKTIVYRVWGKERGLRAMNVDDKTVKTLTTDWDNFPFFSPSGDKIVFTRKMPDDDFEVFTMNPDGSGQQRLTTTRGADAHATWSSDGRQIWFESSRTGFKDEAVLYDTSPQPYAQIFLMNRDGSDVRQFTDSKWEDSMGTFVPKL